MEWGAPGGIMFWDQDQVVFYEGRLAGADLEYNRTEYLPDTEENGTSIREEDQTAIIWYVCFTRENGKRAYVLFLPFHLIFPLPFTLFFIPVFLMFFSMYFSMYFSMFFSMYFISCFYLFKFILIRQN